MADNQETNSNEQASQTQELSLNSADFWADNEGMESHTAPSEFFIAREEPTPKVPETLPFAKPENAAGESGGEDTPTTPEATEAATEAAKALKAYDGDKELDLPLTLSVPVKVDGEESFVTLEKLRESYSGKTAWDKRFSELDNERRQFQLEKQSLIDKESRINKQLQSVNARLKAWEEAVKKGDGKGFIDEALGLMGVSQKKFWAQVLSEIAPQASEWELMTDEERRAYLAEGDIEELQAKLKRYEAKEKESKTLAEQQAAVTAIMQRYQVSPQELQQEYSNVVTLLQQGAIPAETATALQTASEEQVASYLAERVKANRVLAEIKDVVGQVSSTLQNDESVVRHLYSMRLSGASTEDIRKAAQFYANTSGQPSFKEEPEPEETVTDHPPASVKKLTYQPEDFVGKSFDEL